MRKKLKILTTNSAGNDRFGGIHTRKLEQIKYSPEHTFHIIELNSEKKYISQDNLNVHKLNISDYTREKNVFDLLKKSSTHPDFDKHSEKIVNEFQNILKYVNPDIVLIPGTSLTSYFLYKASKRENLLKKTVQEYAGVLEKELGGYSGDTRFILEQIGKVFVSDTAIKDVFYIFPSQFCKKAVEEIHNIKIENEAVIWNGISSEFSEYDFKRKIPEKTTLGYVGRIHTVKNLPFFLNLNENLNTDFILKIITDIRSAGNKPVGKSLLNKMNDEKILYYAPRSRERLTEFYSTQLSATIVPSFFETYCNGAVESLVSGTPTLLSNKTGAKEVFEKYGLSDLIFSIGEINSFKKSLEFADKMNFTIDPELSKQIYCDLSWKKVISKYNDIFELVAQKI